MKTKTTVTDIAALEKELAEIAPFVRNGFRGAGGPSCRVEEAIRHEARINADRSFTRATWPLYRKLAVAAGFAFLLGGSIQLHLVHRAGHKASAVDQILNIGAPQASIEPSIDGTTGLANRLLDIQGLDDEGFFTSEEEEPLWL